MFSEQRGKGILMQLCFLKGQIFLPIIEGTFGFVAICFNITSVFA